MAKVLDGWWCDERRQRRYGSVPSLPASAGSAKSTSVGSDGVTGRRPRRSMVASATAPGKGVWFETRYYLVWPGEAAAARARSEALGRGRARESG